MMKKIYLLFLLTLLPFLASADLVEIDGIYYNLDPKAKTAEVTENPNKYSGNIDIPKIVTYQEVSYNVTSIRYSAFSHCIGLTSIIIPNSVTSIGSSAFSDCSSLTSVTIPNSVTYIGKDAFWSTPWYYNQPDGIVYAGKVLYKYKGTMPNGTEISIKDGTLSIADRAFEICSGMTSISIPNSVTSICHYAFAGCSGLTSINIPNSVTTLGEGAFADCSGLTSINIPNSVISIGKVAFAQCSGLTSINISNGVISIGKDAFFRCRSLTSVTIPKSVTSIESNVFTQCSNLSSIKVENENTKYDSREDCNAIIETASNTLIIGCQNTIIPSSVTSIGYYAFYYSSGLTSIEIPNSVTSIEEGAFEGCSSLKSITIPNRVTSISEQAFLNCTGLTSISIPSSLTYIGHWAFGGCENLTDFYSFAEKLPETNSEAFLGISDFIPHEINATLHVPEGSVDAYKAVVPWSYFKNIVAIEATSIKNLEGTAAGPFDVYDLSGRKVLTHVTSLEGMPNGIYIVNGKKILKK